MRMWSKPSSSTPWAKARTVPGSVGMVVCGHTTPRCIPRGIGLLYSLPHAQEDLGVAAGLGEPIQQLFDGGVRFEGVQSLAQAAQEVQLVSVQQQLLSAGDRGGEIVA